MSFIRPARRATALIPRLRAAAAAPLSPLLQLSQRHFTRATPRLALASPLNLPKWLNENSHLLQPPVNNYCVYNDDMTVMIVGGPNARTDYHINSTPEFFYQYKGSMLLKTIDPTTNGANDIVIGEGELFLLPPHTPHNPVRFANTVGLVLEQKRPADSVDHLRWYCSGCGEKVHEASFHCTDLGTQIKEAVNDFKQDTERRTCAKCGTVCETAPSEEERSRMERLAFGRA